MASAFKISAAGPYSSPYKDHDEPESLAAACRRNVRPQVAGTVLNKKPSLSCSVAHPSNGRRQITIALSPAPCGACAAG